MKKIFILTGFTLASLFSHQALAQSQGPNNPAFALSVPSTPGSPWINPTNCYTSNGVYASTTLPGFPTCTGTNCYFSVGLGSSQYGFNIPVSTITGIMAEVQRRCTNANGLVRDSTIKLLKAGVPVGANKATNTVWPTAFAYQSYGSSSDLWGTTWTSADINNTNFGLYLTAYEVAPTTVTADVDHVRITVYYTTSTGTFSQSISSGPSLFVHAASEGGIEVGFNAGSTQEPRISILNVLGQEVYSTLANSSEGKIQVSTRGLIPGIYFVKMDTDSQGTLVKKIFIE